MVSPILVAAPVTIVPGIAALWYLLKRYEDYFEDARVFLALTLGLFGGLLAAFFERSLFAFEGEAFQLAVGAGTAFAMYVAGYAFFETLVKAAILGLKRYRGRKDSPYYGAAIGIGMSAMMGLGFVSLNWLVAEDRGVSYQLVPFLAMAAVPLGAIFMSGASGCYVGLHMGDKRTGKALLVGTLFLMPGLASQWIFIQNALGRGEVVLLFPAFFSLAYGILLLWIARTKVLDVVVPQEIRDKVRRDQRREARRLAGDEEE